MAVDEEFYLEATNEVDNDCPLPALWAKAMALGEGDHDKAKYTYIKLRVEHLKQESVEEERTGTSSLDALYLDKEDLAPEGHTWIQVISA